VRSADDVIRRNHKTRVSPSEREGGPDLPGPSALLLLDDGLHGEAHGSSGCLKWNEVERHVALADV
jgi:hypothetical protein